MALSLTSADQRRIARAVRVLASPVSGLTQDWKHRASASACAAVGTDTAALVVPRHTGFYLATTLPGGTSDERLIPEYERFYPLLNQLGIIERGAHIGVATRRTLYGPHFERMMRSEYVQEFLASIDSVDAVSILVPTVPRPRVMDDAVQLTLSLTRRGQSVTERHVALARLLHPALATGAQSHAVLSRARAQLRSAVDATGAACLVADRDGRVCHQSPALSALLTREPEREALLERAVGLARSFWTSAPQARGHYAGARISYALAATEITDGPEVFCVVLVTPRRPSPPRDLPARFGLTPRQAEVALLLAERRTNQEIADALAISVHTARHHVEAVLAVLGVRRADVARALRAS